jgi:ABC-type lipoprotein export system ATPase subunit
MPDPIIRLDKASKSFRKGDQLVRALRSIDLEVMPGRSLAVIGRSGSGKSTLLHVMGLLTPLDEGRLFLFGRVVTPATARDKAVRRHFGFIFQDAKLIPDLSILDNVRVPLAHRGIWPSRQKEMALRALDQVELSPRQDHKPNELSGGEVMRAAIARALILDPEILLADEPTGSLDSISSRIIMDLLWTAVGQGRTLVFVTHHEPLARTADRVVRLNDGILEEAGFAPGGEAP